MAGLRAGHPPHTRPRPERPDFANSVQRSALSYADVGEDIRVDDQSRLGQGCTAPRSSLMSRAVSASTGPRLTPPPALPGSALRTSSPVVARRAGARFAGPALSAARVAARFVTPRAEPARHYLTRDHAEHRVGAALLAERATCGRARTRTHMVQHQVLR